MSKTSKSKKSTARKTPAKKAAKKKPAAKKPAAKKTAARKAVKRKPAAKKASAKKPTAKKAAVKKRTARKAAAKKSAARKVARKTAKKVARKAAKKAAKKVAKKAAKKKASAKSPARKAAKKAPAAGKGAARKATAKKATAKKSAKTGSTTGSKSRRKVATRSPLVHHKGFDPKATPIVFSLDDVEAVLRERRKEKAEEKRSKAAKKAVIAKSRARNTGGTEAAAVETRRLGAASLADILGFNPNARRRETTLEVEDVPKKWRKYYKLLVELRQHVKDELDLHTRDTLKHSSKDDSGDLSSYGQHQADAGTDNFDRDFALSLVSSEQEALNEIEGAIQRICGGSYGVCEVTNKPIPRERLAAVPFTRFSVEGQSEYERNRRRKIERGGIFAESAADASQFTAGDDAEE